MVRQRVVETDKSLHEELDIQNYDAMMRRLRDNGWIRTSLILKMGIKKGIALEIGPGPGYLGLEWLKKTVRTNLKALEISPEMIEIAKENAKEYGLEDRVEYIEGNAEDMPFDDNVFDIVFTNASLHEWEQPIQVFNEVYRVLKPDGRYYVSDLHRDMNPLVKWLMKLGTKPKKIIPGLISSINASYTSEEITSILRESELKGYRVRKEIMHLVITGRKSI